MVEVALIFVSVAGSVFICTCLIAAFWPEKEKLVDPVLPSELDDWDAEFTRLTGKTIWQARCEADPELCKVNLGSMTETGTAQNNINPYYQQALLAQAMNLQQQQQFAAQQQNSQLSGLLGGLGSSLGGLFH